MNIYTKANDALKYLEKGAKALVAYQAAQLKANTIFGAAYLLPNVSVAGVEKRQDAYVSAFMRRQVTDKKITEDQLSAYENLKSVSTEMTTSALDALGPGPKTDFDFIVAERSIANLEGTPRTLSLIHI